MCIRDRPVVKERPIIVEAPKKPIVIVKTEEKIVEKPIVLEQNEVKLMELLKDTYGLVESKEDIKRKTIEAIMKLRKEKNEKVSVQQFLLQVHKVIKESQTKSYTMAVTRVISNWWYYEIR